MKPISLRFQAFGPYLQEQLLDFTQLEAEGLFLICGETGAGKTTILDAMCYALYGKSSGGLRGDLSVMRCKLAGKTDETLVEFCFQSGGAQYLFRRSLKFARKKLNDSHSCMVWKDGEFVPLLANPKEKAVSAEAQRILGLTYDQFRQVMLLPQGQFEKLLVSDSAEKEKILVTLFHADRWQKIAEELFRRVSERDAALKQEQLRIREILARWDCPSLEALWEKASLMEQEAQTLRKEGEAGAQELAAAKGLWEQALQENGAFEELRRREEKTAALLTQEEACRQEELRLERAAAAEQIRPQYASRQDAQAHQIRAETILAGREAALEAAQAALTTALQQEDAQKALEPEQAARKQLLAVLENARPLYASLEEKRAVLKRRTQAAAEAEALAKAAETHFSQADTAWQEALLCQREAMDHYQAAQNAYLLDIGGILAQKLSPGQPCPVCGSREHPAPARPGETHITEADLDACNQAMNRANDGVSDGLHRRTQAEVEKNQAAAAFHEAAREKAAAEADYRSAQSQTIPDIHSPRELEARIQDLEKLVADFDAAAAEAAKAVTGARMEAAAAETGVQTAREEAAAAQRTGGVQAALWQAALEESGLGTEERFLADVLDPPEQQRRAVEVVRFRTELSTAQTALAQQQALLRGRQAPDMDALRTAREAREDSCRLLREQLLLLSQTLDQLTRDAGDLTRRSAALAEARVEVDGDLEFANRLRGRSGLSLQRYVLSVMLTAITREANRLLKNVYGGRYQLYRTDEISGSGHKGGLELEVSDAQSQQRRSVTTLSGGEKFLVSLSLAIGLSTVVQAQGSGIRLEAMFIDEGFGSLDREAVNDALEVLQSIRRGMGLVGIISHVEQLAETIPQKIRIEKGPGGSQCAIRR